MCPNTMPPFDVSHRSKSFRSFKNTAATCHSSESHTSKATGVTPWAASNAFFSASLDERRRIAIEYVVYDTDGLQRDAAVVVTRRL